MKTGDPNGRGAPFWPVYRPDRRRVLVLADPVFVDTVQRPDQLAAFEAAYRAFRQPATR